MACETFCLDTDESYSNASLHGESLTIDTVRLVPVKESAPLNRLLGRYHNKNTVVGKIKRKPQNLHRHLDATVAPPARSTILVEMTVNDVHYQPGDHVGIFPANRKDIVDGILKRLNGVDNFDEVLQLQLLKENHSTNGKFFFSNFYVFFSFWDENSYSSFSFGWQCKKKKTIETGVTKSWEPHEKLPACSLRTLLMRFLDITTPPTRQLLTLLASFCEDKDDEERLNVLANVSNHQ